MRLLRMDAYIGTSVLMAIGVVLLAFLGLMSLFAMLEELREDDTTYLVSEMLIYVALTLPRRIYEVLPYVVFLGALIGLGSLASRSEIVIFRAAGISPGRIYFSVAWPAALVFVLGFALGEWVAPGGEERAAVFKAEAMSERAAKKASRGYWYREGLMNMRAGNMGPQGELLAQATSDQPQLLLARLDMQRGEQVRRIWPYLRDRRVDAYQDLVLRFRDQHQ